MENTKDYLRCYTESFLHTHAERTAANSLGVNSSLTVGITNPCHVLLNKRVRLTFFDSFSNAATGAKNSSTGNETITKDRHSFRIKFCLEKEIVKVSSFRKESNRLIDDAVEKTSFVPVVDEFILKFVICFEHCFEGA